LKTIKKDKEDLNAFRMGFASMKLKEMEEKVGILKSFT
jgi:hypothetical protein